MKSWQQIRFVEILYSLRSCVEFVLQSRTRSLCSKSSMEYSEEERMGKKRNPCPFIGVEETIHLPTCLVKLAYSPSAVIDGAVGLPTSVLMRIP